MYLYICKYLLQMTPLPLSALTHPRLGNLSINNGIKSIVRQQSANIAHTPWWPNCQLQQCQRVDSRLQRRCSWPERPEPIREMCCAHWAAHIIYTIAQRFSGKSRKIAGKMKRPKGAKGQAQARG